MSFKIRRFRFPLWILKDIPLRQGIPLETLEVVLNLIGSTKTKEGLEVHAWLDGRKYEKGRKISNAAFAEIYIKRNKFHGDWNYEIHPRT